MDNSSPSPGDTGQKQPPPLIPLVVGIGASAGGLAALKKLFSAIPEKNGLAFVVIVHLAPDHESHLAEILQPHAKMPVLQVNATTPMERDHIYIIPPGRNLSAIDTHLRLSDPPSRREGRAPIDHFFSTLAQTHDGQSVGVILTGTGADGTLGIGEIKAKGGIVIVQDPAEAEFDGMPRSAVATGLADLVLPLADIPPALLRLTHATPELPLDDQHEDAAKRSEQLLRQVFTRLRNRTGRDFSRYKRSTILRRIANRMQLLGLKDLEGYLERLREQPDEARQLSDNLLVTVTSFFRDAEVFQKLEAEIIPSLFQAGEPVQELRLWSVGCATGEEAYSLAILLLEAAARHSAPPTLQVFATDMHEASLQRAREGLYLGAVEQDVSPERLKRWFTKEDSGYRVRREVREMVVFAQHNVLGDPPFSRLDLISCRNLLIYLERDIQRDVIELFHYALKPGGYLVLGTSETADAQDLYQPVDRKHGIYRKRNVPPPEPRLPVFPTTPTRLRADKPPTRPAGGPAMYGSLHERMLERYAPPSVLVSADDKVVHLSQNAGRYMEHPGGELTTSVLKLVREELRVELRAALHEARRTQRGSRSRPIQVRIDGAATPVVLDVRPALQGEDEGYVLVMFDDSAVADGSAEGALSPDALSEQRARDMAAEIEIAHRRLHTIVAEYEAAQEQMKVSNEELQSSNEELRSTLEELETTKEELQSMNEELQTVNQENRNKVQELSQLSGDLQNLLAASDIATLFLDRDFRIMRFTPKITKLFNIRDSDRGRPLTDLTHQLGYDDLLRDATYVLERLVPVEREVQDSLGKWYLTRVLPYRGSQDRIEGVVITFFDISERKQNEESLVVSERQLEIELKAMTRLHRLATRLLVAQDLSSALQEVLDATMEISGASMGNIQLFNPALNALEIVAQRGFKDEFLEHFRSVGPEDRSSCSEAMRTRQQVVIEDVSVDPRYAAHRDIAAHAGYRAVQSTPLLNRDDELLGMLSTHYEQPGAPSEHDLRTMYLYSRQAADFIEHLRRHNAQRESDRHKDEFLAMLGHELRNPLAAIYTSLQVMRRAPSDPTALAHFLDVVERQSKSLLRLVDDMLQISRVTRGKIRLQPEPVALSAIVANAVEESQSLMRETRHELVLDVPESGLWVQGDPTRLTQVFANLLNNAHRYTPEGGHVWVTAKSEGGEAVMSVRDSGIGIAAEHLSSIFDLFYQSVNSGPRSREGLGIGLALVKSLVDLHGGKVEAHSAGPGQGSEFIVRLPLVNPPAAAAIKDASNGEAGKTPAATRKILIVDDDPDQATAMARLLGLDGHEVRVALDGEQGLEAARTFLPDAALLDISLPKMDGYALARAIRAENWGRSMQLIAQTGHGQERDRNFAMQAGFDHFLVKPIDIKQVAALLREARPGTGKPT